MEYFIMNQDPRVSNVAKPVSGSLNLKALTREQIQDIAITKTLYVKEDRFNQYPDFMEETGMLVSKKLMKIMSKYQRNVIFKTVVVIEKNTNHQEVYYLMSVPEIDCASDKTVYDEQAQVVEFILDEDKVGHTRIFCASNYGKRVFVRLDVAESILRRNPYGVSFEEVTVEGKEGI